ncbi:hypothetical protein Csa_010854 [Cucumis sativus]|uniref:Uncharacterized protein n=1 Tax=Cucumis sativus TaxID=3659 RepID=A0A0A0L7W5_CUCSA|nr:hypothetical protein Csa_010854 [Cucumis sativus]
MTIQDISFSPSQQHVVETLTHVAKVYRIVIDDVGRNVEESSLGILSAMQIMSMMGKLSRTH